MPEWTHSFCSNVVFVIPVWHTFQSYSHRFVVIDNASLFGLAFPNTAAGSHAAICGVLQGSAAGIGISNFLRSFCMVFKFFIICFNEEDVIFWNYRALVFSTAHSCFALLFDASDTCFHISGHTLSGLEVVCFLVSLDPKHVYPSGDLSFSKLNIVKPVHASDNSLSALLFQQSAIGFSNNTSSDVCVVLVTSMYFNGIGNDSSFGM